jgi:2-polyprenyl-6-methoxyphenol hydroxylase-like FAD-dependent oxidoreductase
MNEFFPGMMDELVARGARRADNGNFLWFLHGRWKLRRDVGLHGMVVSRACLEGAVRRSVRALPNVVVLDGVEGLHPVHDSGRNRVVGLVLRKRGCDFTETLDALLVVDASGRGSKARRWLEQWGYGQPTEDVVQVNVGYATRLVARRPGDFFDSCGGLVSGAPRTTRLAAVNAIEGDRWMVTLAGCVADYPSRNVDEWEAFAASLPVPAIHELLKSAEPLTDIVTYRFAANHRRRYERMKRLPAGLLVIGDALCSFNPIYGQGMSVAALEAKLMDECLAAGLDNLARRFFARSARIVDMAWMIAAGEDLRFPGVDGRRPPGFRLLNRYLDRVHALASVDVEVCRRFFEVVALLAPPAALMSPRVAWRVLSQPQPQGEGSPLLR